MGIPNAGSGGDHIAVDHTYLPLNATVRAQQEKSGSSSEREIRRFARELCGVIDMKSYGEPLTPSFGEYQEHTKGYSLLQFIETSSILGHFSESTGSAYINIFSCKQYDYDLAERFTKEFFGAKRIHSRYIIRD